MSYPNQQAFDYEPVTRRVDAGGESRASDEQEFAAPSAFEFPSPRFAEAENGGQLKAAGPQSAQSAQPSPAAQAARRRVERTRSAARRQGNESWIVKRGHTLTYLGIFLFTFVVYFRPYELIPALSAFSSMALVLAVLTLGIYLPTQLGLEGNLTARPREVHLLLLLTFTALLSIPFAIVPGEAWATFNDTFIKAVLMFIVMVNVVRTEWRLKGLIWLALGVGCLLSLNALDNYRAGNFTVEGYRVEGDLGGMFGNPNDMALHLVTVIPLAVALLLTSRKLAAKALYAVCALLMLAGTVVTFSRGGFIGLLFGAGVMAWKLGRRNRLVVTVVSLVTLVCFLALSPSGYGTRLLSLFNSNLDAVGSSSTRMALLKQSVKVALRWPIFGVGMGNFHIKSIHEQVSHNAYTQVAAEMGMTAMVLYTLFIVTPLRRLWQIERETFEDRRQSHFYYLAVGIQASLVAYLVSSFFASVAYQWYVYYLVAYAIALRRIYDGAQEALKGAQSDEASATEATEPGAARRKSVRAAISNQLDERAGTAAG
ncbi:MAG: O-antigen ligase family protein [Acidobacteria bacterium]|nr:O-antigen ligase family protein [Acidobacteriota bacterium]